MKKRSMKKIIFLNVPYVFFALLATKLGQAARLAPGIGFSEKALYYIQGLSPAFQSVLVYSWP